ncbi:thioredoxin [Eshraghiella crossota]|uniref:thioredoxin n=1 Tax=Eshraghiella crossota TaxID=45851 RepID=UPI003F81AF76
MMLKHVCVEDFEDEVLKSDVKVLVDFYADWCGPCKMMAPVLEEIAENNNGFKIVKLNVDENMSIAEKYNIMSIPALFVFDKGEVVNKSIGLISKNEVLDLLK